MKRLLCLPFFFLCSQIAAQPTIEWADHYLNIGNGHFIYRATDAMGTVFDLGNPDSVSNAYDMRAYKYEHAETGLYVGAQTTPYASLFPSATFAIERRLEQDLILSYIRYDSGVLFNLGAVSIGPGTTDTVVMDPPEPMSRFPLRLGDSWDYRSNPIRISPELTRTYSKNYNAVSAGFLDGTECLLLKVTTVTDESRDNGSSIERLLRRHIAYDFYIKQGGMASIVIDTLDAASSSPHVLEATKLAIVIFEGVESSGTPGSFSLHPAYPNPVPAGTDAVLSWSNEGRATVRVSVFDALGREAAVLYEGNAPPGVHTHTLPTGTLRPGIYFVRVQSGATVRTTPFVVQR